MNMLEKNFFEGGFLNRMSTTKITLMVSACIVMLGLVIIGSMGGILPLRVEDFSFFSILFFLFALYRPGWAFLFFMSLLPLETLSLAPGEWGISLRPYQVSGVSVLVAIAIRFVSGRLPFSLPKTTLADWLLVVLAISGFLSLANAPVVSVSVKQSVIFCSFLSLYALSRVFIRTVGDIKNILPFFTLSSLVVGGYAVWQNVRFAVGKESFQVMVGRPNGTFAEADWLGMFMMLVVVLSFGFLYTVYFCRRNMSGIAKAQTRFLGFSLDVKQGIFLAGAFLFSVFAFMVLTMTVSRSAWLGACVAIMVFFGGAAMRFSWRKSLWNMRDGLVLLGMVMLAWAGGLVLAIAFHLTTFQIFNRFQSTASGLQKITIACDGEVSVPDRIETTEVLSQYGCRHILLEEKELNLSEGKKIMEVYRNDPTIDIRRTIYEKSVFLIKEHPFFGIGWGSSAYFLGKDERGAGLNASNMFLEIWLGSGLIGIMAFLTLWLWIPYRMVRRFFRLKSFDDKAVYICMLASWAGITVFNMFNSGIFLGFFWVWLAIAVRFSSIKIPVKQ